jgi:hypothetical protein
MSDKQSPSLLDLAGALTGTLVAVGTILISIFPFAVPAIALITLAAIPLVALGLIAAVVAVPVVLVRRLARRVSDS